jgi:hypothetical protein
LRKRDRFPSFPKWQPTREERGERKRERERERERENAGDMLLLCRGKRDLFEEEKSPI